MFCILPTFARLLDPTDPQEKEGSQTTPQTAYDGTQKRTRLPVLHGRKGANGVRLKQEYLWRGGFVKVTAVRKRKYPPKDIFPARWFNASLVCVGLMCPNKECEDYGIADENIHALVGCGSHGKQEMIQDLICQACRKKFSVRRNTIIYRLKTPSGLVE